MTEVSCTKRKITCGGIAEEIPGKSNIGHASAGEFKRDPEKRRGEYGQFLIVPRNPGHKQRERNEVRRCGQDHQGHYSGGFPRRQRPILMHDCVNPRSGEKIKRDAEKQAAKRRFAQATLERSKNQDGNSDPGQKRQIKIRKSERQQDSGGEREQYAPSAREIPGLMRVLVFAGCVGSAPLSPQSGARQRRVMALKP